jgi:hypothetical protein
VTQNSSLAGYGFTENKLLEIQKLYEETAALHNARKKEYGDRIAATSELNAIWKTADRRYMRLFRGWILSVEPFCVCTGFLLETYSIDTIRRHLP